jgi:hypothetical protein
LSRQDTSGGLNVRSFVRSIKHDLLTWLQVISTCSMYDSVDLFFHERDKIGHALRQINLRLQHRAETVSFQYAG